ncbi:MAG: [Fe-Fe] hydrogenase large subunit C-terminal domain-containing protein [Lachnospirales bacterium]
MSYIKVRKANCKNCYKCLKNCLVKSIKYVNDKVEIIEDACILCGVCMTTCPQKAKKIQNDIEYIKEYVANPDITTVVSLDPSFVAAFGENAPALGWALKSLGFDYVEEAAIGAKYVTKEYLRLIKEGKINNIISSACPAINMYVQKYYPNLTKWLAPVMSPALVHGRIIKEQRGADVKVIHLTPCLARIKECNESQFVDGVITYEQLMKWLLDANVTPESELLKEHDDDGFDNEGGYSRIYPIVDGIVYDLQHQYCKFTGTEYIEGYDLVAVSGLANVTKILDEMEKGNINHAFVEASSCYGGCVNGPFMPKTRSTGYKARIEVKKYADNAHRSKHYDVSSVKTEYKPEPIHQDMPTEEQIRAILSQIGKNSRAQELNCGSCGYATCREKAIAVYQKKADLYICMPYMTDINQAMSNVTLSLTPNYIIAVDSDMYIKEFNVAAQKLFNITRLEALNQKLSNFIDTTDFEQVIANKSGIYDKKVSYPDLNIVTEQTIVYSSEKTMAIAIIKDVTQEEKDKEALYNRKMESVNMAQKVIDKQMIVAQQIASLLGETTAETKVTLNKLKNLIDSEEMNNG